MIKYRISTKERQIKIKKIKQKKKNCAATHLSQIRRGLSILTPNRCELFQSQEPVVQWLSFVPVWDMYHFVNCSIID